MENHAALQMIYNSAPQYRWVSQTWRKLDSKKCPYGVALFLHGARPAKQSRLWGDRSMACDGMEWVARGPGMVLEMLVKFFLLLNADCTSTFSWWNQEAYLFILSVRVLCFSFLKSQDELMSISVVWGQTSDGERWQIAEGKVDGCGVFCISCGRERDPIIA
jgi:hypothetical protein